MNRNIKSLLCGVLATSLLLSACGSGGSSASSLADSTGSTSAAPASTVSDKGVFPVTTQKIELTCFAMKPATIEDLETNLFTKELEEKTNIHLNWQTTTDDGLKEKRNILFASGDYPDIMLSAKITPEEQMLYGSQGVLIPLNDLIDEYCVELPRLFEEIEWLRPAITAPDGNIYSLPQINECYHCTLSQKLWINSAWLKQLNLSMPTTTDEFEQVLLAFKTQDPNGNSKNDEVPLSGAITGWNTGVSEYLMNAFIYNDGSADTYRVRMDNKKVDFVPNKDEFREGLRWINKLYQQGLIDPAAYTQPADQFKQLGMNEPDILLGAGAAGSPGSFAKIGSDRSNMYEALPPLKGPGGVQTCYYNPYGYNVGAFSITSANKNPIETIKWIDYLYSEEGTRRANEGREGEEWVKPDAGVKGINGEQAAWKRNVSLQDIQNITWQSMDIGAVTSYYRLSEVAGDPFTVEGFESRLYNETFNKYEPYKATEVFPPVFIPADLIDEMAQLKSPIMDYVKQSMAKFITGSMDIEKDWDSYVEGLNKLKVDRYVELLQTAYDASAFAK